MASHIGRSATFVSRLETGRGYAALTPELRVKIASLVEVPVQILFPDIEIHEVDQGGAE